MLGDPQKSALAESVAALCRRLVGSKESSGGDGWEGLFVLFLLARCLTSGWQEPALPEFTFVSTKKPAVLFNEPFDNSLKSFDECASWNDLKDGVAPGEEPALSICYPTHARFVAYDAIVTFSENKKIKRIIGYQLKEGKNDAKQPRETNFFKSFVLKGVSPNENLVKSGWLIPGDKEMDEFFGVSGMYWTPKKWKELSATEGMGNQTA